jgi:predicted carbohydrate-binding protein with CBM5 and CBM33 domain
MMSKAINAIKALSAGLVMLVLATNAFAHGYVQDPPARNWYCGFITKPDHVSNGTAQFPVCGDAFFAPGVDPNAGYNFMSVLSHSRGHAGPAFPASAHRRGTTITPR